MPRVLSLFLPTWPTDRLRRMTGDALSRDVPLALKSKVGSKRVISAVDDLARRAGLYRGMSVAKIETLEQNPIGQTLYPSLGFVEVARQIHYALRLD